jgi:hypothetical protein
MRYDPRNAARRRGPLNWCFAMDYIHADAMGRLFTASMSKWTIILP